MIRFSASEAETQGLLRFLERRARRLIPMDAGGRGASLLYLPLLGERAADLHPRLTPRRLLRLLRETDTPQLWGIRLATDAAHPYSVTRNAETGRLVVDTEASRLILLAWGNVLPEEDANADLPERRREGIIELRDWVEDEPGDAAVEYAPIPKGVVFLPQTVIARDLVERCARRLRRRGSLVENRWHVPPHLPPDDLE